jgi:hypothetical protein
MAIIRKRYFGGAVILGAAVVILCLSILSSIADTKTGVERHAEPSACIPVDPIRVRMGGIEYQIPAFLQPSFLTALRYPKIPRRSIPSPNGGPPTSIYCQSTSEAAAEVETIRFERDGLAALAARNPDNFGLIIGPDKINSVIYVSISAENPQFVVPDAPLGSRWMSGVPLADGLFRRREGEDKRFYSVSSDTPLLYGRRIAAFCRKTIPDRTYALGDICTIHGHSLLGYSITVMVTLGTHPVETWPSLLVQIEAIPGVIGMAPAGKPTPDGPRGDQPHKR